MGRGTSGILLDPTADSGFPYKRLLCLHDCQDSVMAGVHLHTDSATYYN
jgi:hypothetical protein